MTELRGRVGVGVVEYAADETSVCFGVCVCARVGGCVVVGCRLQKSVLTNR